MLSLAHADAVNAGTAVKSQTMTEAGLWIRPLGQEDLAGVEQHLLAFDAMDRHARFGTAMRDAAITAYVQRVDLSCAVLVGAVDGRSGKIVGLAEAQPALNPNRVEMAVSVHPVYRRRGLGQRLLRQAVFGAFAQGAGAAEFVFSPENRPVLALVRKLGARIAATFDHAEILCTS